MGSKITFYKNLTSAQLQKLVCALMGLSLIYLIFCFIYPAVAPQKVNALPSAGKRIQVKDFSGASKGEIKPCSFYLQGLQGRRIFSVSSLREKTPAAAAEEEDLIKNINLIGIVSGNNTQVVIEDRKIQKTYYLRKGQFIGEIEIEDIQTGKVILNYKGQKYELYI